MKDLFKLFEKEGEVLELGANHPFLLNEPDTVWLVIAGRADIFAVKAAANKTSGSRAFVFSAGPQNMLLGLDRDFFGSETGLVAVSIADTKLLKVRRKRIQELALSPEYRKVIYSMLAGWITGFSSGVRKELPPKNSRPLETGKEISLKKGETARAKKELLWVKHLEGTSMFARWGVLETGDENTFFPVSEHTWLKAVTPVKLVCLAQEEFFSRDPEWRSMDGFHRLVLDGAGIYINIKEIKESDRINSQVAKDNTLLQSALEHLSSVFRLGEEPVRGIEKSESPLFAACRLVCQAMQIQIQPEQESKDKDKKESTLQDIARLSRFRTRNVILKDDWWKKDNGPLLCFVKDSKKPAALIPISAVLYEIVNPADGTRIPLTETAASGLSPEAYAFYRPFPEKPLNLREIFIFGLKDCKKDLISMALTGVAGGLLGMLLPLVTGLIFDTIIPSAERGHLFQIALALLFGSLGGLLFQMTRSFALLRIQTRMDNSIQASIWDRLLSLPAAFFRKYSAGDLAMRANGINQIKAILSDSVLSAILSSVFSIFNFFLLFYYSMKLAFIAAGLALAAIGVSFITTYIRLRYDRDLLKTAGKITGMVLQYINGISKLRVAGAEFRAYFRWAKEFSSQRKLAFNAQMVSNISAVFMPGFQLFSMMAIFWFLAFYIMKINAPAGAADAARELLSTGSFLGFNTAFGQFMASAIMMNQIIASMIQIIPLYERLKPILETPPEIDLSKSNPGELSGSIEMNNVCFSYSAAGPAVLKNISIKAGAGEFVALVGPSGSGKSTIFRLLLGFEKPLSGSIYFDEWNLSELDLSLVRNQMGVVIQNSRLMAGDIFSNIVGATGLTLDNAWEAARMAGLEEDINQMPMGMHTFITEGGGTISGGQRQRLMIARALIRKPRIILFDEATSALDNRTQEIISKSLENLDATRIVIAHRLSTIINADRIYVILNGEVIQTGTYKELIAVDGPFSVLSKRQII